MASLAAGDLYIPNVFVVRLHLVIAAEAIVLVHSRYGPKLPY